MKRLLIIFAYFSLVLLSCKKHFTLNPSDNPYGLPNATQTGANTFGFLLNGQAWTPHGNNGYGNLSLYYDAGFSAGVFNLSAYRNTSSSTGHRQALIMYSDTIQVSQKIILPNKGKFGFSFWDESSGCNYSTSDSTLILSGGFFDLEKLDKVNGIFSGKFELSFKKTGCPNVQITQGRFDMKL